MIKNEKFTDEFLDDVMKKILTSDGTSDRDKLDKIYDICTRVCLSCEIENNCKCCTFKIILGVIADGDDKTAL